MPASDWLLESQITALEARVNALERKLQSVVEAMDGRRLMEAAVARLGAVSLAMSDTDEAADPASIIGGSDTREEASMENNDQPSICDDPVSLGDDCVKLTREQFTQKYWSASHPIQTNQYVWMDVDVGRDEIEQLILNNIQALRNYREDDWPRMKEWVLKQISAEQTQKPTDKNAQGELPPVPPYRRRKASIFDKPPTLLSGALVCFVVFLLFCLLLILFELLKGV